MNDDADGDDDVRLIALRIPYPDLDVGTESFPYDIALWLIECSRRKPNLSL